MLREVYEAVHHLTKSLVAQSPKCYFIHHDFEKEGLPQLP